MRFFLKFVIAALSLCVLCAFPLQAGWGGTPQHPEVFGLELHVGGEDGSVLAGPLGLNEELVVTARLVQLGSSAAPVLANVIWQLYTASGEPVPGFNKTRQVIGLGNQEYCQFKIRSGELANGIYFIGLTHQNAIDPTQFYQGSASFEVHQPLAIKQIIVAESPRGKTGQRIFYEDQSPHIFVSYFLADEVYTALVQIDVVDEAGTVRASRTVFKDKDFSKKSERVGIKLPPALFKAGERATVNVTLSSPDAITVTATSWFEILAIDLGLHFPAAMTQGTVAEFQLFVPQTFNPPYTVQISADAGFILKSEPGSLSGTLVVTGMAEVGPHSIGVTVSDVLGNKAEGTVALDVEPGKARAFQRRDLKRGSSQGGGYVGSSTGR